MLFYLLIRSFLKVVVCAVNGTAQPLLLNGRFRVRFIIINIFINI